MEHQQFFNTLIFFTGFMIPVGFQFSSLVFGFIRNSNKKKYRLGGDHNSNLGDYRSRGSDVDKNGFDQSKNRSGSFTEGQSGGFHDRRLSELSAHSGLNIDYFDPPLLDYQQLFNEVEEQSADVIDKDQGITSRIFESSPKLSKKQRSSMNLNPSEYQSSLDGQSNAVSTQSIDKKTYVLAMLQQRPLEDLMEKIKERDDQIQAEQQRSLMDMEESLVKSKPSIRSGGFKLRNMSSKVSSKSGRSTSIKRDKQGESPEENSWLRKSSHQQEPDWQDDDDIRSEENFMSSNKDDSKKTDNAQFEPRASLNSNDQKLMGDDNSSRSSGRHYSYDEDDQ